MVSSATLWWCWEPPPSASPWPRLGLWQGPYPSTPIRKEGGQHCPGQSSTLARPHWQQKSPNQPSPPSQSFLSLLFHLSCLLVSTLSSKNIFVQTHSSHQHRHIGSHGKAYVPAHVPSLCTRHLYCILLYSCAPFLHGGAEHLMLTSQAGSTLGPTLPCRARLQPRTTALVSGLTGSAPGNPSSSLYPRSRRNQMGAQ